MSVRTPAGTRRRTWAGRNAWAGLALALVLAACDSPEERAEKHYERGQELVAEGALEKAALEFRSALDQDDRHVPTLYALGLLYEQQGDTTAAFQQYRHVIDLAPTHFEARLKTARYYVVAGALESAEIEIDALLELNPVNADVQALAARLAMFEDRFEDARAALDKALELDPANVEALAGDVEYLLRTGDARAALRRLDEALALQGTSFGLHTLKLRTLQQTGDTEGVGDQLGAMIAAFPEDLRLREVRARWAVENDRPGLALTDLEFLADAAPDQPLAVVNLVRLVRQQQGREAARAILARRMEQASDPDRLKMILARFDIDTGQPGLAIAGLRELAGAEGPERDNARLALAELLAASPDAGPAELAEADALIADILAGDATHTGALAFQVEQMIGDDQLEGAIHQVRIGLNAAPDDVRLLLLAGRAQELSGNSDLANDRMAKAVRNDSHNPRTSLPYVRFLLRTGRIKAAEIVLTETARRYPQNRQVLDLLGFTRVRLENWHGAGDAADRLARLDPERARQLQAAILIGQEQFEGGARMLADLPDDAARREASIVAAVQAYIRAGQTGQAVAFLDGLIASDPDDIRALGIRGNLHLVAGELDLAEARYRDVLAIEPKNGNAFSALSRLARRRGDTEGATALLDQGIAAAPDNVGLLARRAVQHEKDGEFGKAIALYERVYARAPGLPMIANNLASLLADHGGGDPAVTARAYAIASRLKQSEVPQFRDTYGWTRHLHGEHDEALAYIEPLTEALPDNPWIWYHLGEVYAALNRRGEARTALETALEKGGGGFVRAAEINDRLAGLASN